MFTGAGTLAFNPVSVLRVIGLDDARSAPIIVIEDIPEHGLEKHNIYCGGTKRSRHCIQPLGGRGADEGYKNYFRGNDPQKVIDSFNSITTWDPDEPTLSCEDYSLACSSSYSAYSISGKRKYCSNFSSLPSLNSLRQGIGVDGKIRGCITLRLLAHKFMRGVDSPSGVCSRSVGGDDHAKFSFSANVLGPSTDCLELLR